MKCLAEEQLAQNRRLLELKGVTIEEEMPEVKSDSQWILDQYQKKKDAAKGTLTEWDVLEGQWNPNGTLSQLTAYKNGEVLYKLDFVWNSNGSLSQISRS